jgi:ppGpp synthetase/RelA/SpoT-type nucleotidyltranferase
VSGRGLIERSSYPSVFGDLNRNGVPDVDDPSPYGADVGDSIEEVRLSDEIGKLIDVRGEYVEAEQGVMRGLRELSRAVGNPDALVEGRVKTPYSMINKLRRKRLNTLTDVAGTRLVLDTQDEVDRAAEMILRGEVGRVISHEDFYARPNGGYRAHHFIVEPHGCKPDDCRPVEIQLKSRRLAMISEASHTAYKSGTFNQDEMARLTGLAMLADAGDRAAISEFEREVGSASEEQLIHRLSSGGSVARMSNPDWSELGRRGVGALEELGDQGRAAASRFRDRREMARDRREVQAERHDQMVGEFIHDVSERVRLGEITSEEANQLTADYQDRLAAEDRATHAPDRMANPHEPLRGQREDMYRDYELRLSQAVRSGEVTPQQAEDILRSYERRLRHANPISTAPLGTERDRLFAELDQEEALASGWCRICSERLPPGQVVCPHHATAPMDERWDDLGKKKHAGCGCGGSCGSPKCGRQSNPVDPGASKWAPAQYEESGDDDAAEQLATAADSDGTLYPLKKSIIETLGRRRDRAGMASAFGPYIDQACRVLAKENQDSGEDRRSWVEQYPKRVRRAASEIVADSVDAELRVAERDADANAEIYAERSPREGGRARLNNPLYPALGPQSDMVGRKSNPAEPRLSNPASLSLPEDPWRYFAPVDGTFLVPVADLATIRARPKGIANAEPYMLAAYEGRGARRAPISVSRQGDVWQVEDGNSTTAIARQNGWLSIPAVEVEGRVQHGPERHSNPSERQVPLKLLQPVVGSGGGGYERLSNPASGEPVITWQEWSYGRMRGYAKAVWDDFSMHWVQVAEIGGETARGTEVNDPPYTAMAWTGGRESEGENWTFSPAIHNLEQAKAWAEETYKRFLPNPLTNKVAPRYPARPRRDNPMLEGWEPSDLGWQVVPGQYGEEYHVETLPDGRAYVTKAPAGVASRSVTIGPRFGSVEAANVYMRRLAAGENATDALVKAKAAEAHSWAKRKAPGVGEYVVAKGKAAGRYGAEKGRQAGKYALKHGRALVGRFDSWRKGRKDNPEDLSVANEILRQLGGAGRLTAMIGARNFVGGPNELQFKWAAKAKNGANTVSIHLDPSDTYTVSFYSVRGASTKEKKGYTDVYNSELVGLFERETGLYLRMNNPVDDDGFTWRTDPRESWENNALDDFGDYYDDDDDPDAEEDDYGPDVEEDDYTDRLDNPIEHNRVAGDPPPRGTPVESYLNLNVRDRVAYSVRNKKTREVTAVVPSIVLEDVSFRVSEAGRQRVLKEKRKNVHAWVSGEYAGKSTRANVKWRGMRYNPYETKSFVDRKTGRKLTHADYVKLSPSGAFYANKR